MDKYIPEVYKKSTERLENIIERYHLDRITVESMVRSCIEVEEQEIQPASATWRSRGGRVYSTKASNIKVNLRFALSSVFRLKTIFAQDDFWLALAMIHLIVDLFTNATKEIDEISSVVLVAVYRLQHADKEKILEYAEKICPESIQELLSAECVEESLEKLECWGCIDLINGRYSVKEIVTASMVKGYQEKH